MDDTHGGPSYELLGAESFVKDDRLLPRGHVDATTGPMSTSPVGVSGDSDFGPGGDTVRFALPVSGTPARVEVSLLYQTVSPRYLDELLTPPSPEATALRSMVREGTLAPENRRARERRVPLNRQGTTTVEVKSGYGLTVRDEARSLALARQATSETTFLGAHVVPEGTTPEDYVALVTGPMLDACAPYAKWVDVFCERGAFDADQARAILQAGAAKGLRGRLHANQLGPGPGVQLACELGLTAVDHCTYLSDEDVSALRDTGTVATLLPGVEFSTRSPYPDARALIDAGVQVALASDCNPGSCYTSSIPLCIALAVREMGMSPAEALAAATVGGARALGREDVGHLRRGASADLVVLEAPSYLHLAYRPGVPLVREVFRAGRPL